MNYKKMIKEAKEKGFANESKMWESINAIEPMLAVIKEEHPEMYDEFMRNQHELMFGSHYNESFANEDVEKLMYTDKEGKKHTGAHWTKDEVIAATNGLSYPQGTTDCDKYVAYNAAYADFNKDFSDGDILKIAYRFYFADEDAPSGKIWKYMKAMKK